MKDGRSNEVLRSTSYFEVLRTSKYFVLRTTTTSDY
jgi:hypothetical protein